MDNSRASPMNVNYAMVVTVKLMPPVNHSLISIAATNVRIATKAVTGVLFYAWIMLLRLGLAVVVMTTTLQQVKILIIY